MAKSEFLLLSIGEGARVGGTVRVVASAVSEEDAQSKLEQLEASVLGRVAVVEVKQLYERQPAVQNIPSDNPLFESEPETGRKRS